MNRVAVLKDYFKDSEFDCNCGKCGKGIADMQPELLNKLTIARDLAGIPFIIISAVRCPAWNAKQGGKTDSAHLRGYAADVRASTSSARLAIVRAALAAGFNRIGVYGTFIHMDCDPSLPQQVMWHGN
ncbi:putative peptidase M15 [Aeromonas phage P5]|nr:putative peptidase M15 [Aeromonas phage P5]